MKKNKKNNTFKFNGEKHTKTNTSKIALLFYEEHFYPLTDLSQLLSCQLTAHNGKVFTCFKCQAHYDEEKLNIHERYCNSEMVVILSEEGKNNIIRHVEPQFKFKPAICIYGDFETFPISYSPV